MKYLLILIFAGLAFSAGLFFNRTGNCQTADFPSGTVEPAEFSRRLQSCNSIILDVRTADEFKSGHLGGAVNNDFNQPEQFENYLDSLDKNKTYFIYCRTGKRSAAAMKLMADKGFNSIVNLDGGITAWQSAGLPVVK